MLRRISANCHTRPGSLGEIVASAVRLAVDSVRTRRLPNPASDRSAVKGASPDIRLFQSGLSGESLRFQGVGMKKLLALTTLGAFMTVAPPVFAADNAQQERMKLCNTEAADKQGDERKKFMSSCLSAKKLTQQEKMKNCNVKAVDMKGDDRKTFMSECLKS
jgi:psiF repeat